MKCQPRVLTPYVDGELGVEIRAQVEEHLRGCPSCGALLDEVTIAADRVRGMGRATIPISRLAPSALLFADRARLDPEPGISYEAGAITSDAELASVAETSPVAFDTEQPLTAEPEPWTVPSAFEAPAPVADAPVVELPGELPEEAPEPPILALDSLEADLPRAAMPAGPVVELERDLEPEVEPEAEVVVEPEAESEADLVSADDADVMVVPEIDAPGETPLPPWMTAESIAGADLDADGRRAVDEAMQPAPTDAEEVDTDEDAAQAIAAAEITAELDTAWNAPILPETIFSPVAEATTVPPAPPGAETYDVPDEVRDAVQRMRQQLAEEHGWDLPGTPAPPLAESGMTPATGAASRVRKPAALPGWVVESLPRAGAVIGGAALLAALAWVVGNAVFRSHPSATVRPGAHVSAGPTGAASAGSTHPTPAASTGAQASPPVLTGAISSGNGGTGFTVQRLRTGVPAAGVARLVLDLGGIGATPTARLGKGPDGAVYLEVTGMTVDPAVVSAYTPAPGAEITGITLVAGAGTNLRITLASPASFAMAYLASPSRLVIDFGK